ncbi:MAG: hypothetical protein R2848_05670 [Thermomicrobiales bacterium]
MPHAVHNVERPIASAVGGIEFENQRELDATLIALDGTPNKSRLGANAILGVSLAYARAVAAERGVPLYRQFADIFEPNMDLRYLPRPTVNLFSGGKHAGGQVEIQDIPAGRQWGGDDRRCPCVDLGGLPDSGRADRAALR